MTGSFKAGPPVRVAVVIPAHWSWRMGGSQQQAMLLINRMAQKHDVNIRYFAARTGEQTKFDDHDLVNVAVVDELHKYGFFWEYFSLQKELRRFGPDVIYQRVGCAFTGIAAIFAKRNGIPLVWHIASISSCQPSEIGWRGLQRPHALLESRLANLGVRYADLIVAQTQDQATLLESNHRRKPDYVIANFQPVPRRISKSSNKTHICWIANLKGLKRPELFIELAETLSDQPDCHFSMVGAPYGMPSQQREFETRVRNCANLEYLGQLNSEEVGEILGRSHIVVNRSTREGFSNVFIEAWMHAVPVLTLGIDPDGTLQRNQLGFCCDSISEMALRIRELASDYVELQKIGDRCRQYAVNSHSLDNADRLASIIVEVGKHRVLNSLAE